MIPAGMARPLKRNCASGLFSNPRSMRLTLIGSEEAVRALALTWLEPPKMMPLVFW